jgi:S-adenosylhomocysteine hydrolase
MSNDSTNADTAVSDEVTEALQAALAGEHACVYGYGVVGSYLSDDAQTRARRALEAHELQRDNVRAILLALDVEPVAALPAYTLPFTVDDAQSARELARMLEERLGALYTDVIGFGGGGGPPARHRPPPRPRPPT